MAVASSNDAFAGLNPVLGARIRALVAASGGQLRIMSGYRSVEEQQHLFAAAVKKYGSEAAARKWVAVPGHSHHNQGLAVDLGGNLQLAHQLAPRFGLYFPMGWEPWHVEARGVPTTEDVGNAYTLDPQGQPAQAPPSQNPNDVGTQIGHFIQTMIGGPGTVAPASPAPTPTAEPVGMTQ